MCCGSSHGWGHLLLGHSLWGVSNGVTHVTMGSPILRRLANFRNPFSLEVSVAFWGGSILVAFHLRPHIAGDLGHNVTRNSNPHRNQGIKTSKEKEG